MFWLVREVLLLLLEGLRQRLRRWLLLLMLQGLVHLLLRWTCPDVKAAGRNERWWPATFAAAMTWLALFSYVLCLAADGVTSALGLR